MVPSPDKGADESVRGTAVLKCSQCSANSVHWTCVAGTKYAGWCATCDGETMETWKGAGGGAAAPNEIIYQRDLEGEEEGAAEVVQGVRGEGICHHNRQRSQCRECGGSSI